ncbi:hypothetical protein GW17_00004012 [Ensete ventricosum]|nr:hypothetical protein GW17_00004012 [Ensete ventricosum]
MSVAVSEQCLRSPPVTLASGSNCTHVTHVEGLCTFGIEPGHVDSPVNGFKKHHFSTRRRGRISQEHPPMNPLSEHSNEEVSLPAPNTFDMKDNHLPSLKWTHPPWHKHRDTIGVCSMTSVNPLWGRSILKLGVIHPLGQKGAKGPLAKIPSGRGLLPHPLVFSELFSMGRQRSGRVRGMSGNRFKGHDVLDRQNHKSFIDRGPGEPGETWCTSVARAITSSWATKNPPLHVGFSNPLLCAPAWIEEDFGATFMITILNFIRGRDNSRVGSLINPEVTSSNSLRVGSVKISRVSTIEGPCVRVLMW